MGLCYVAYYCSDGMNWALEKIEDLYSASIPSQMVLLRFWTSMASIIADMDAIVQEQPQSILQEASQ